jgi:hypothetical protein
MTMLDKEALLHQANRPTKVLMPERLISAPPG